MLRSIDEQSAVSLCVKDPLNSGDDVSDSDPTEVFDAENVIVCQFDKVQCSAIVCLNSLSCDFYHQFYVNV